MQGWTGRPNALDNVHNYFDELQDCMTDQTMDGFLASVEKRAFCMAMLATSNRDDALDLVQDAMMKLVQKYSDKTADDWKPLFYRILETRILDWHRKQNFRRPFRAFLKPLANDDGESVADPIAQQADIDQVMPDFKMQDTQFMQDLEAALKTLPVRQQQVFLLRLWEGMDIKETAIAMNCSQSSVKTHYARALAKLQSCLEEHHHD